MGHKEGWVSKYWWFWIAVLEKTPESSLDSKEIKPSILKEINPEYSLDGLILKLKLSTLASWCKEPPWKRPYCCEGLRDGGEGDDRGWDAWMASPTQCKWVWANSRRWWRTGRPGVQQSMGSQRVRLDLATEQQHFHGECFINSQLRQIFRYGIVE